VIVKITEPLNGLSDHGPPDRAAAHRGVRRTDGLTPAAHARYCSTPTMTTPSTQRFTRNSNRNPARIARGPAWARCRQPRFRTTPDSATANRGFFFSPGVPMCGIAHHPRLDPARAPHTGAATAGACARAEGAASRPRLERHLQRRAGDSSPTNGSPSWTLSHGAQPLMDVTTGAVLAVNGEIYNHRDLRAALGGPRVPDPLRLRSAPLPLRRG